METVKVHIVECSDYPLSKVEILRGLITEKMTTAVQEILLVVETTIAGYDKEVFLLRRELDQNKKQLEAILQPEVRLCRVEANEISEEPTKECHESMEQDEGDRVSLASDISDLSVSCPAADEENLGNDDDESHRDGDDDGEKNNEWKPPMKEPLSASKVKKNDLKPATDELEEQAFGAGHEATHRDEQEDVCFSNSAAQSGGDDDDYCGDNDEGEEDLSEHEEQRAAPKSKPRISAAGFNCKVCGIQINSKRLLTKHSLEFHLNNPKVLCGVCGRRLDTPQELKSHLETHAKLRQCEKCGRRFLSWKGMQNHSAVCQTDRKAYPDRALLKKPFQCDRCPKSFAFKSMLQSHYSKHTGEKPFCCEICGTCLVNIRSYKRHKLSHTGEKHYNCKQCEKVFSSAIILRKHEISHKEKEHLCEFCSKAFTTKTELQSHQNRIHEENPLVTCPVCSKQLKGPLKHHMKIHTGERPFSCTKCSKSFKTITAHKNHMNGCLGVKPFSCSVCDYKCSRKEHLQVHMSTHTGNKRYRCSLCDKSFTQSHCLKSHMKKHHTEDQD